MRSGRRIAPWGERLAVAAVNGPAATVVSGEPAALDELAAACAAAGIRTRRIPVDYASHSPQVESLREQIVAALAGIAPGSGPGPDDLGDDRAVAGRARRPAPGTGTAACGPRWSSAGRWRVLAEAGHGVFVEVSPHPVLTAAISESADATVTGTLRRDDGGPDRFLASLAEAARPGRARRTGPPSCPPGGGSPCPPTPSSTSGSGCTNGTGRADAAGLGQVAAGHPLLGAAVDLPAHGGLVLTGRLSAAEHPWLADVTVGGRAMVPGAVLAEMALRAGNATGCGADRGAGGGDAAGAARPWRGAGPGHRRARGRGGPSPGGHPRPGRGRRAGGPVDPARGRDAGGRRPHRRGGAGRARRVAAGRRDRAGPDGVLPGPGGGRAGVRDGVPRGAHRVAARCRSVRGGVTAGRDDGGGVRRASSAAGRRAAGQHPDGGERAGAGGGLGRRGGGCGRRDDGAGTGRAGPPRARGIGAARGRDGRTGGLGRVGGAAAPAGQGVRAAAPAA